MRIRRYQMRIRSIAWKNDKKEGSTFSNTAFEFNEKMEPFQRSIKEEFAF